MTTLLLHQILQVCVNLSFPALAAMIVIFLFFFLLKKFNVVITAGNKFLDVITICYITSPHAAGTYCFFGICVSVRTKSLKLLIRN